MVSFPPHCSHKLQPLDGRVFALLKRDVATATDAWMRSNPEKNNITYIIPSIVKHAWTNATMSSDVSKGFEVSGIYLLNIQIFNDDDFAPTSVTDRPVTDTGSSATKEGQLPWRIRGTEYKFRSKGQ